MTFAIRRLAGALGAELHGPRVAELDDAGFKDLLDALHEHLVVFLPDQHLTPDEHRDFARRFGEVEIHPFIPKLDDEHPEIVRIASAEGQIADVWHTDVTWSDSPPLFSVLNMQFTPDVGGDTMWSSQVAVFEALSAPMQELLLGLTAVHHAAVFGHPEQQAVHPVVRRHPVTGRASLFVNRQFTKRIVELSPGESKALLEYLYSFSEQPLFNYRRAWTPGTIAIWDNRVTQHYVVNDFDGPRTITRVTILGDDPQPAGDVSRWLAYAARNMSAAASPFS